MRAVGDHPLHMLLARANGARRGTGAVAADAERVLEQAFSCSHRLAVYGTLAPGEQNHHLLAECPGTWSRATVHGRRADREFPVFTYDPSARPVGVHVLESPALATHWRRLDDFEGSGYCRILVAVYEGQRLLAIANLYESRTPVER